MLRRFFPFSFHEEPQSHHGASRNGATDHAVAAATPIEESHAAPRPSPPAANGRANAADDLTSFEQIYQSAAIRPPSLGWGILKVAEMVSSPYLTGMSADAKRCSLLMALDAAGAEIEDVLQDAVVRQRALNDYEEAQKKALQSFEAAKLEDNRRIQAELDRLTEEYMARIQANLDEVTFTQNRFRAWQKQKQHESQRITEAAAFCVPQSNSSNGNGLTSVLERATRVA